VHLGLIPPVDGSRPAMFKRPIGIIFLVYLIIGVIVAWEKGYLHLSLLKAIGSAILAILLWWLPLLGISLHIH
jgi:hypothetical protein